MAEINDVNLAFLDSFRDGTKRRLNDLTDAQLAERPHPGVNPVGFTVWHALRNFDRTFTSVQGGSPDDEVWQTGGFTARSGYDPRGKGFRGSGMGTGYTRAQVAEVPATKELLVEYADALHAHVSAGIRAMTVEQLLALTVNPTNPQGPQLIVAQRIIGNIGHGIQHLGEADVLRSLWGIPDPTTPQEEM